MSNISPLPEHDEAILRYVHSRTATLEKLIEKFRSPQFDEAQVVEVVRQLADLRCYIEKKRLLRSQFFQLGESFTDADYYDGYVITELGKGYLARSTSSFTSISNINNSNIAHQSSNVKQTISLSDLPQDIQEKIKELELAIIKKDSSAMKKAFGYLADKSIDTAIAVATGVLLR